MVYSGMQQSIKDITDLIKGLLVIYESEELRHLVLLASLDQLEGGTYLIHAAEAFPEAGLFCCWHASRVASTGFAMIPVSSLYGIDSKVTRQ